SSAYMAFSHGGNDGQKTMGVIALALAAYGAVPTGAGFYIPDWVKVICALSIGLGTATGGWRIIRTMGMRITALKPVNGVAGVSRPADTSTHPLCRTLPEQRVTRARDDLRWWGP